MYWDSIKKDANKSLAALKSEKERLQRKKIELKASVDAINSKIDAINLEIDAVQELIQFAVSKA